MTQFAPRIPPRTHTHKSARAHARRAGRNNFYVDGFTRIFGGSIAEEETSPVCTSVHNACGSVEIAVMKIIHANKPDEVFYDRARTAIGIIAAQMGRKGDARYAPPGGGGEGTLIEIVSMIRA